MTSTDAVPAGRVHRLPVHCGFYRRPVLGPARQPVPVQQPRDHPAGGDEHQRQDRRSGSRRANGLAGGIQPRPGRVSQPAPGVDPHRQDAACRTLLNTGDLAGPCHSARKYPPDRQHHRRRPRTQPDRSHRSSPQDNGGDAMPGRRLGLPGLQPGDIDPMTDLHGRGRAPARNSTSNPARMTAWNRSLPRRIGLQSNPRRRQNLRRPSRRATTCRRSPASATRPVQTGSPSGSGGRSWRPASAPSGSQPGRRQLWHAPRRSSP